MAHRSEDPGAAASRVLAASHGVEGPGMSSPQLFATGLIILHDMSVIRASQAYQDGGFHHVESQPEQNTTYEHVES